jgi:hypothetical protein
MIDLYDREIIKAEKVMQALNDQVGKMLNLESFRKEIIERFEEIGLVVETVWHTTDIDGCFMPDIVIKDRCQPLTHGFDFEEHQWEVLGDKLGIDTDRDSKKIPFNPDLLHANGLGGHNHSTGDEEVHKVEKHHD